MLLQYLTEFHVKNMGVPNNRELLPGRSGGLARG